MVKNLIVAPSLLFVTTYTVLKYLLHNSPSIEQFPFYILYSMHTRSYDEGKFKSKISSRFYFDQVPDWWINPVLCVVDVQNIWCTLALQSEYFILYNGILLPKLFWPTVRKKNSSDREKLLKFEAEGREFAKFLRSLEQFIQTVKGQNNFW